MAQLCSTTGLSACHRDCFSARWHAELHQDRRNVMVDRFRRYKQALGDRGIAQTFSSRSSTSTSRWVRPCGLRNVEVLSHEECCERPLPASVRRANAAGAAPSCSKITRASRCSTSVVPRKHACVLIRAIQRLPGACRTTPVARNLARVGFRNMVGCFFRASTRQSQAARSPFIRGSRRWHTNS